MHIYKCMPTVYQQINSNEPLGGDFGDFYLNTPHISEGAAMVQIGCMSRHA